MPPSKPPPAPEHQVHAKVARDIGKHGWTVLAVMPTEDQPADPFAYTIGLYRTFDHPELIITGWSGEDAHAVYADLIENHIAKGVRFEPDRRYPDLFPGSQRNYDAEFREVSVGNRESMMLGANRWNAYEPYPALQVIWPDPANLFPWEDNYDRRFIQALLQ